jgi:hypothetical protein
MFGNTVAYEIAVMEETMNTRKIRYPSCQADILEEGERIKEKIHNKTETQPNSLK